MNNERCKNCRFAFPWDAITRQCRKRAPVPCGPEPSFGDIHLIAVWPTVNSDAWCGDYERKEAPPARPVSLFPRTERDPFGMGDGCQAWFDL